MLWFVDLKAIKCFIRSEVEGGRWGMDEVQSSYSVVATNHSGEDVKIYRNLLSLSCMLHQRFSPLFFLPCNILLLKGMCTKIGFTKFFLSFFSPSWYRI